MHGRPRYSDNYSYRYSGFLVRNMAHVDPCRVASRATTLGYDFLHQINDMDRGRCTAMRSDIFNADVGELTGLFRSDWK